MSERLENWRNRLAAFVASVRSVPYEHGVSDSWLFAMGAVEAMTGVDHAERHRGRYKTARGALGVMRRAGAANMAEAVALYLEEIEPVTAQIGDVMAIPIDGPFGHALGILNGERVLVVTPNGIDSRDRAEATRAFRV